ncbi:endoribonuclease CG2145 [Neodiprion lecontei]|uniref:Endoribonuclease CG2145 n=1 Tax=Neodiprion lecontei TaxID=441921 RepID=A0A6J0BRB2_NEOLC|nr:endoribonuclease CG2145 [Neodiprion lecontei]
MEVRPALFALLAIGLLVGDVDAGWKFWKSSKKDEVTTTTTTTTTTVAPAIPSQRTPTNPKTAVLGAADPGLAIGVGSTGTNIRNNARPNRPNPGTEVGLDIPAPKPNKPGIGGQGGQGYRDWAVGLTGAGEPGQPGSKLPNQGPAQQPTPNSGSRPGTPTGQPVGGQSQTGQQQPGSRPGTPTGTGPAIQPGQSSSTLKPAISTTRGPQGGSADGKPQVSTLNIGSLNPGSRPGSPTSNTGSNPQSRPGSPTSTSGGSTPTGGKTWADIAATNSRPGSPTPSRSGSPTPSSRAGSPQSGQNSYPGQGGSTTPGQSRPSQVPVQPYGQPGHQGAQQPGRTGPSTGGAIAAGAVGGAVAATTFSSNPTYSKGNTVTDEDLIKLAESLFIKDVNNANRYITLNLQKRTTGSSAADEAPQPLLSVRSEALQIPTIQKVLALYNNYEHDIRTNEYVSPAERAEESLLVDTFLSTNVMSAAMRFLADKGFIRKDYYEYKDTLRRLWFNLYSRGEGKIGSSGFEHVFLSESKLGTEVIGLHNWIYYNAEEVANRANYLGYIKKVDLGDKASILKIHTKLNGVDKPVTSIFVGTSPELEMALYTVCFFVRPDTTCPVSLGGTPFNIVTHKFKYRGKEMIGSAHPDI